MFFNEDKKSLRAIYIMNSIQGFGFSLIGIFLPIYFLTLGYSLTQVFIFFIIQYLVVVLASFAAVYFANHFGLEKTIFFRFPFLFLFLILLLLLEKTSVPLALIALIGGIQTSLYFTPLHILFANNVEIGKMGESLGKYFALSKLSGIIGPIIGGVIAYFFGFKLLFFLAIIIFLLSVGPYLNVKQTKTKFSLRIFDVIKLYKKYPKYFWAEVIDNIGEEADGIIWPIFIFLFVGSVVSVGAVGTLVGLGSFIFTFFIGQSTDKYNKKNILKWSAIFFTLIWLFRFFINNEFLFYVSTLLAGFTMTMFIIPFTALIYNTAKENNKNKVEEFIVFREIPVAIGRIIIFSLALLFVSNIKLLFPIAGLSYLYFLFF
ncbi:MAG: MFS transporter [Candidatus Falkowbacteria bacterium]|nr:MFS transporter [Candidatus Falkowbacteria bacterium]